MTNNNRFVKATLELINYCYAADISDLNKLNCKKRLSAYFFSSSWPSLSNEEHYDILTTYSTGLYDINHDPTSVIAAIHTYDNLSDIQTKQNIHRNLALKINRLEHQHKLHLLLALPEKCVDWLCDSLIITETEHSHYIGTRLCTLIHLFTTGVNIIYDCDFIRTFGEIVYRSQAIIHDLTIFKKIFSLLDRPESSKPTFVIPVLSSLHGSRASILGNVDLLNQVCKICGILLIKDCNLMPFITIDYIPFSPGRYYSNSSSKLLSMNYRQGSYSIADIHRRSSLVLKEKQVPRYFPFGSEDLNDCTLYKAHFESLKEALHIKSEKILLLHLRNRLYYGDENPRNCTTESIVPALKNLIDAGYHPLIFSQQEFITDEVLDLVCDYPSSGHKNKYNDSLVVRFANLFLGSPSGPMGFGYLYKYPTIAINYWPYLNWPIGSCIVLPKLYKRKDAINYLSLSDVESLITSNYIGMYDIPPDLEIVDNDQEDISCAVELYLGKGNGVSFRALGLKGEHCMPIKFIDKYSLA